MKWLSLFAAKCPETSSFLGFPNWYRGLECEAGDTGVKLSGLNDIWVVVANITEIALRVAALAAIVFIIIGGVMYMTSTGEPEKTKRAVGILINSVVGLLIAVFASVIVGFIADKLSGG